MTLPDTTSSALSDILQLFLLAKGYDPTFPFSLCRVQASDVLGHQLYADYKPGMILFPNPILFDWKRPVNEQAVTSTLAMPNFGLTLTRSLRSSRTPQLSLYAPYRILDGLKDTTTTISLSERVRCISSSKSRALTVMDGERVKSQSLTVRNQPDAHNVEPFAYFAPADKLAARAEHRSEYFIRHFDLSGKKIWPCTPSALCTINTHDRSGTAVVEISFGENLDCIAVTYQTPQDPQRLAAISKIVGIGQISLDGAEPVHAHGNFPEWKQVCATSNGPISTYRFLNAALDEK